MIPSAHSPKQQLAQVTAIEVFGKLSDLAADAGYFIDLEKSSDYRILVRAPKHRRIPKKMQDIMKTCGERYGYKILFT